MGGNHRSMIASLLIGDVGDGCEVVAHFLRSMKEWVGCSLSYVFYYIAITGVATFI
jgi:hypothetical protein